MGLIERLTTFFSPTRSDAQAGPEGAQKRSSIHFIDGSEFSWGTGIPAGYTPLDRNPEVVTACSRIAELISSMTIYLMANTEKGDIRLKNELSRKIDINPNKWMTRSTFINGIVMNMLLYGSGNAIVIPHTTKGLLGNLEPIAASRVSFNPVGDGYTVLIDGKEYDPDDLLHFVYNPHPRRLWRGQGVTVALADVVNSLGQASKTKQGFMRSEWKPSLIIKVDAFTDTFASKEGRRKIIEEYISSSSAGEPWVIPDGTIDVKEVRPLTLGDLAISDSVTLDKKTVASILGVPSFLLGVGDFNSKEWDAFINNTIRPLCREIEQEMTRKLIISEKWYLMFNIASLYSYDLKATSEVYVNMMSHGLVTGNEARAKMGLPPLDGLDELVILENYIPREKSGLQKKLKQEEGDE